MDETDKATQDAKTSGSKATITSGGKEKTYTEQEVTKMVSDIKAAAGREQKKLADQIEAARQDGEKANNRFNELQKQIDEAELDKVRDDPELLKLYQRKRETEDKVKGIESRERDLAKREAQLESDKKAIAEANQEAMVVEVALNYGLSIETLEDLGITDREQLDKVAERIAAFTKTSSEKEGEEGLKPDSGISSGGEHTPTAEELEKMTPEQYAAWRKKTAK